MQRAWLTRTSLLALSLVLVVCLKGPSFAPKRDTVLFKRGLTALERGQFDVAALDFQKLVNSWPDSEYAERAKQILSTDPRLNCHKLAEHSFTPPIPCRD